MNNRSPHHSSFPYYVARTFNFITMNITKHSFFKLYILRSFLTTYKRKRLTFESHCKRLLQFVSKAFNNIKRAQINGLINNLNFIYKNTCFIKQILALLVTTQDKLFTRGRLIMIHHFDVFCTKNHFRIRNHKAWILK